MNIAIIPARGGSKRIPQKNIKFFCGKPIIAWSIDAAKKSGCFDRIFVSTDDIEVAIVAQQCGAEVPFLRPAALSDDYTATGPVMEHAIKWFFMRNGFFPEYTCCLYATAPFVHIEDIRRGLNTLKEHECDYSFGIAPYVSPIQRAIRLTVDGRIEMIYPEEFNTRSQDLEETYHDAGQFYWGKTEAWLAGKSTFSACSVPIVLPHYRVQDIDTIEDWTRAEWIFKSMQNDRRIS